MVLITHDLTPDRRVLLRQGVLDVVIDQDPVAKIDQSVAIIAHAYGCNGAAPQDSHTPLRIHVRENC